MGVPSGQLSFQHPNSALAVRKLTLIGGTTINELFSQMGGATIEVQLYCRPKLVVTGGRGLTWGALGVPSGQLLQEAEERVSQQREGGDEQTAVRKAREANSWKVMNLKNALLICKVQTLKFHP